MKSTEILTALGDVNERYKTEAEEENADKIFKKSEKKGAGLRVFKFVLSGAALLGLAAFIAVNLSIKYSGDPKNIASTGTTTESDVPTSPETCNYGLIWEDYIFRRNEDGELKKINIHDGKESFVCPVKGCTHNNKSCPLYGLFSWAAIGNTFYYVVQDYDANETTLYAFDVVSGETETVKKYQGMQSILYAYEERLLMSYAPSWDRHSSGYYLWYDVKTGQTDELDSRYIGHGYLLKWVIDDRMVWCQVVNDDGTDGTHEYYDTNLKGLDYRKHDFGNYYGNHYRMVLETDEEGNQHYNMYVTLAGETEEKLILTDMDMPLFTENKIVYTKTVPKEERRVAYVEEDTGRKVYDRSNGDVYVMDPDGSNAHLLFHTDECIMEMQDSNSDMWLVSGDWFAITAETYKQYRGILGKLIIANVNTGEFVVAHTDD